jgi:small subunit ribosomal protein S12
LSTFLQKLKTQFKKKKKNLRALAGNPHRLCVVFRVRIVTPRKPNSARRQAVKAFIFSTKDFMRKHVTAYLPGSGHKLRKHSNVLVRGGGARDLPGVRYHLIRGVYDLQGVASRKNSRSKYGTKKQL